MFVALNAMDFQSLYEKYSPAVRRFALFLCGDPMMADEITSDAFVRVGARVARVIRADRERHECE